MSTTVVRRTRVAALLAGGVAVAAALGAGAAAMSDALANPPLAAQASEVVPTVTPGPGSPPPTAAAVDSRPSAAPPPAEPPPAPAVPFLDMRTVAPWLGKGQSVTIPDGVPNCPRATVRLGKAMRATVKGVEYAIGGDASVGHTDMNRDGRIDEVVVLRCSSARGAGQAILVIEATGPASYATVAAKDVGAIQIGATRSWDGVLTTYSTHYPVEMSTDVRTFALRKGVLVQTSASPRPVDWRNATVRLPRIGACAAGTYTFAAGRAAGGEQQLTIPAAAEIYFADFRHDGGRESVLEIHCAAGQQEDVRAVVALSATSTRTGTALGLVLQARADALERLLGYQVSGEIVHVSIERIHPKTGESTVITTRHRWAGATFTITT